MSPQTTQWSRSGPQGPAPRRALAGTVIAIVLAVSPIFLVGAVAVLMRDEFALTQSRLGVCVAVFYGASALASVAGGRFADRKGGLHAAGFGVAGSAIALVGIAVLARRWEHVVALLILGGLANGITQPATNRAVARSMPASSQGLAFGVKQTDGALATLVSGLAASLIAVTFGWRWAIASVALGAAAFFLVQPGDPVDAAPASTGDAPGARIQKRPLLFLAFGMAFATGAGVSMGSFFVDSAVSAGTSVRAAGWLLAGGSVAAAVARVAWGWRADRHDRSVYPLISILLLFGAAGLAVLGSATGLGLLIAGTALTFAGGWGWPGLLLFGIVRDNPSAPGESTGIVITGGSAGGVAAPLLFGWLAEHQGYPVAWRAGAVGFAMAAALVFAAEVARRRALVTA